LDLGIEDIDDNESSFCGLWSRTHRKIDCVELFSNPNLGDDYFFNRLNINNYCNDNISDTLNFIKNNYTYGLNNYYIHLICNNENPITKLNIPKFGTMKILSLEVDQRATHSSKHIEIKVVDKDFMNVWIDIFCRSFDSMEIKNEVTTIISQHFNKLTLLIANYYIDEIRYPVGCCLLFKKNRTIGLYCLGTIHQFRKKGVARELISNAAKMVTNDGCDLIILQALTKERSEEFYKRLGFKTVYKKILYTFYLN